MMIIDKKSAKCNLVDGNIQLIILILMTEADTNRCNFQTSFPEKNFIIHSKKAVMDSFFKQRL